MVLRTTQSSAPSNPTRQPMFYVRWGKLHSRDKQHLSIQPSTFSSWVTEEVKSLLTKLLHTNLGRKAFALHRWGSIQESCGHCVLSVPSDEANSATWCCSGLHKKWPPGIHEILFSLQDEQNQVSITSVHTDVKRIFSYHTAVRNHTDNQTGLVWNLWSRTILGEGW